MTDELKKSLSSIIYERTTSPLYGTFIISWILWNWRIIYLTVFISEKTLKENKIDYIINHYSNIHFLITFPLISTAILLTVIPFIANGAYWLSIIFEKWKAEKKNAVELKQLLTIEQSIDLREQILKQEERFQKLLSDKNSEIEQLKAIIKETENLQPLPKKQNTDKQNDDIASSKSINEIEFLAKKIKGDSNLLAQYKHAIFRIQSGYKLTGVDNIDTETISLLEAYDTIEHKGAGIYTFTKLGKMLQKQMSF